MAINWNWNREQFKAPDNKLLNSSLEKLFGAAGDVKSSYRADGMLEKWRQQNGMQTPQPTGMLDRALNSLFGKKEEQPQSNGMLQKWMNGELQPPQNSGRLQKWIDGQNTPSTATGEATPLAASLLRKFEGFRDTPYWDVNAHRTGYGSDTVTLGDGSVQKVSPGMKINREDAERDLDRRISTEFMPKAAQQVGQAWGSLSPNAQAALTSVAYNYGSLPNSVVQAAQTGDLNVLSQSVLALSSHNGGVNAGRRQQEAAIIAGQADLPASPQGASYQPSGAPAAPQQMATSPEQQALIMDMLRSDGIPPEMKRYVAQFLPQAPTAQKMPNSVQEYEYARQQGFNGSYMDFQQIQGQSRATNINMKNEGNIPPGYRAIRDQNGMVQQLEPIPGSPAAMEAAEARDKELLRNQKSAQTADIVVQDIDKAMDILDKGWFTTGLGAYATTDIPGSSAHDLSSLVDTIEANVTFDTLQNMRAASPTGGALGQVSDNENRLLGAAMGSLQQSQSKEQFKQNLKRVRKIYLDIIHGPGNRPQSLSQSPSPSQPQPNQGNIQPGFIRNGFKFIGGNPNDPKSWERIR